MRLVQPDESSRMHVDHHELRRALAVLTQDVFEVRIPKAGRYRTVRGYFNDLTAAEKAVAGWNGQAPAIYLTLNPVNPALLARANNRMETYAETTSADTDILHRRWLLVDVDPKRPAGISSSEAEHAAALKRALDVRNFLTEQGWPAPIYADSGNGGHLLYRVSLANEPENTQVIQRALQAMASRFDTVAVGIDTGVFNASRISKLYGTYACKGDHTSERPHRLSRILELPGEMECLSLELLEELAKEAPAPTPRSGTTSTATPRPGGDFFASVNQYAMDRLNSWVLRLFPDARPYRQGYRITSRNLKRDREEDLGIQPDGIKDFGVHDQNDPNGGRRTPIDLVMEWGQARDAKEAALWLCDQMGIDPGSLGWKKPNRTRSNDWPPANDPPPDWEAPPWEVYEQEDRKAAPTAVPPPNEFIPLAEFIAAPPKHSYLIKHFLPAKGLAQVFGSSNVGKSFLMIDLAMHIALGLSWRGMRTKRACVLYIAAEGLGGLAGRMKAWTQRYGMMPDRLFIRPYSVQLTVAGAAAALAERIRSLPIPPQMVILDTLAANFGPGDENSAQDMAIAMEALRQLAGDWLGICVHHSGHGDKTRGRGHSSLFAALDTEIQVSRDDQDSPIKVVHTKVREGERMDPLFFRLESEALPWADEDGEAINSAVLMPLDDHQEPDKPVKLTGGEATALQALVDLYAQQQSNLGADGVARVTLADWQRSLTMFGRSHRKDKIDGLIKKGKVHETNGFVYVV
jgi:hypothetical protein